MSLGGIIAIVAVIAYQRGDAISYKAGYAGVTENGEKTS